MSNLVILGMQWGDEGKGKIVDLLCPAFEHVARFQGGHNAGHTVKFKDRHFALHLIPSGVLHAGVRCYLGNGMVIEPKAFVDELTALEEAGVDVEGRLFVSDRAHVLAPVHGGLDRAREDSLGRGKIGTTSRGIGPAYEAKVARLGLRIGDLLRPGWEDRLAGQVDRGLAELERLGRPDGEDLDDTIAHYERYLPRLRPLVADVGLMLHQAIGRAEPVLFEGAQGAMLDVDHGTYPYVTSSSSTVGGVCTGTGAPAKSLDGVIGILKAYTTRVGGGPFPTELEDAAGEELRERGNEYGTSTGRPRRCGWLDLVVARYATRISGIESVALTKLDVLDHLEEIKICTAYRVGGDTLTELPASVVDLAAAEPVYETVAGWRTSTDGILEFDRLPPAARRYVERIEEGLGAGVDLVSTGPRREETIVRDGGRLGEWVGDRFEGVLAGRGA